MPSDARVRILGQDLTKNAFKSLQGSLSKSDAAVKKFGGVLAGVFAANRIGGEINRVIRLAESVTDLGTKLGVSAGSLTEWKFIVERTGASFNNFTQALQRQSRRLAEAQLSGGKVAEAIQQLGLNLDDLLKLPADETFERIAARIRDIESPAEQVRLAFALWDSGGVDLLKTINGVTGGFDELRAEALATGNALSDQQVRSLKLAQEAWDKLSEATTGFINTVVVQLAPAITAAVDIVRALFDRLVDIGQQIGGIAAAVVQAAQLNFTEAGRIVDQLFKDDAASIERFNRAVTTSWDRLIGGQKQVKRAVQETTTEIAEQSQEIDTVRRATFDWEAALAASRDKLRQWATAAEESRDTFQDLGQRTLPTVSTRVRELGQAYESLSRSARETNTVIQETQNDATPDQQRQRRRIQVPSNGYWIYGIGNNRVLMRGMQAVRKLWPGEGLPQGGFATGTSQVPRDMTARLEAGERVISNNTTVNIDITGAPTDTFGSRDWIRSVLVPEIARATRRTV